VRSHGSPGARATTTAGAQHPAGRVRTTAPFGRRLLTVAGMDELGAYRVLRAADPDGPLPEPGQFAMLAAAERWGGGQDERPYLPRAFSFARHSGGESHFLLEDVGPGSRRLCELRPGDGLWVLGPLGQGFAPPRDEGRRPILVGGGVGIAPLAILKDTLCAQATALLGFRDAPRARGASLLGEALLASDDGSVGHHGAVTDLLAGELQRDSRAVVYACGPPLMLEAVRAMCAAHGTPAQLALEAGMACGFGACFGCVVPRRGGGYLRVCLDGPVLDAAELERVHDHAGAPR
jgi:dihydroorotate dehydrogenase electron transfer subunit